jgi:hypothetical protein
MSPDHNRGKRKLPFLIGGVALGILALFIAFRDLSQRVALNRIRVQSAQTILEALRRRCEKGRSVVSGLDEMRSAALHQTALSDKTHEHFESPCVVFSTEENRIAWADVFICHDIGPSVFARFIRPGERLDVRATFVNGYEYEYSVPDLTFYPFVLLIPPGYQNIYRPPDPQSFPVNLEPGSGMENIAANLSRSDLTAMKAVVLVKAQWTSVGHYRVSSDTPFVEADRAPFRDASERTLSIRVISWPDMKTVTTKMFTGSPPQKVGANFDGSLADNARREVPQRLALSALSDWLRQSCTNVNWAHIKQGYSSLGL